MAERGSTHHSPRLDEEMRRETESIVRGAPVEARADEQRLMEGAADDEPTPDTHLNVDLIELRSMLAASLRPSAFPASASTLLEIAEEEYAPERVLAWLRVLPAADRYATVEEVWTALGGRTETRDRPLVSPPPREAEPVGDEMVADETAGVVAVDVVAPAHEPSSPVDRARDVGAATVRHVVGVARTVLTFPIAVTRDAVRRVRVVLRR